MLLWDRKTTYLSQLLTYNLWNCSPYLIGSKSPIAPRPRNNPGLTSRFNVFFPTKLQTLMEMFFSRQFYNDFCLKSIFKRQIDSKMSVQRDLILKNNNKDTYYLYVHTLLRKYTKRRRRQRNKNNIDKKNCICSAVLCDCSFTSVQCFKRNWDLGCSGSIDDGGVRNNVIIPLYTVTVIFCAQIRAFKDMWTDHEWIMQIL